MVDANMKLYLELIEGHTKEHSVTMRWRIKENGAVITRLKRGYGGRDEWWRKPAEWSVEFQGRVFHVPVLVRKHEMSVARWFVDSWRSL